MKKKLLSAALAAVMALSVLSGCSSSATEATTATASDGTVTATDAADTTATTTTSTEASSDMNQTLTVASYFFPVVLEPTTDWESWYILEFGFGETLTQYSETGEVLPWLAESWEAADDGLTWTIKLREDVVFSNGEPMTATKVKESLDRLFYLEDPENGGMGNPYTHFTYTSLEADDEAYTVTMVTTIATPDLPGCLAYPWTMIVDAEASESMDTKTQGAITTGPYVISAFDPGISITGVRNDNYWNGTPGFEEVVTYLMTDSNMRAMALLDGSINYTVNLDADGLAALEGHDNVTTEYYPGTKIDYDHINLDGVLGNDTLRQAVLMSIDGDTIADKVLGGSASWGYAVVPSGLDYGYDQLTNPYAYDPTAAMEMLDAAGIVDTDGDGYRELDGTNVEINYVTESINMGAQARAICIEAIGLKVNLNIYEDVVPPMNAREFDIVISNDTVTPTGDPAKFMAHWYSTSNNNYAGYNNPEYDATYELLLEEYDADMRREYVIQLQQMIIDDALVLVEGYPNVTASYTTGLTGTNMGCYYFYQVTPEMQFQ